MKLSIITINYNNCTGLKKTIDSVICQTWRDFEWIIIDGGSTDGSKELILSLNDNPDANLIYWCSEPDKGIYNAMNKGVCHAVGEYLVFMNSGDAFADKDTLTKIFEEGYTADIIIGRTISWDDGRIVSSRNSDEVSPFLHLLYSSYPHQATLIRRTLLQKYPYVEDYKIVSDWKFWMDAIVFGECSIAFSDVIVAKFDMEGISNANSELNNLERKDVLRSYFPPMVLKDLGIYMNLRLDTVVNNSQYLLYHSRPLYIFLRKLSSLMVKVHRLFSNATH